MKSTSIHILLSAIVAMGLMSCSGKKAEEVVPPPPAAPAPPSPGGTGPDPGLGGQTWSTGDTVVFTPTSFATFAQYVGTHPLNDPKDFRLNVHLSDYGSGRYGGDIRIAYNDTGASYEGIFTSGAGTNQSYCCESRDDNVMVSEYNRWFVPSSGQFAGKKVFSGFFQDEYGAIVLVIENTLDTGDGQGGGFINGSVWYRNFAQSFATASSLRSCWFIYRGPYDCRSSVVINKSDLWPTDTYTKLGTFSGMSRVKAFGN